MPHRDRSISTRPTSFRRAPPAQYRSPRPVLDTRGTAIRKPLIRLAQLAPLALVLALTGCVERRLLVRTNPPGAMVEVDGYPIGQSPVSTNFTYYGTRRIRLVKDGYETEARLEPLPPPWYEIPPLDFIAENLVPGQIHDQRVLDYQLKPQILLPTDQVLDRAEQLRSQTQATAAQVSSAGPPGITPSPMLQPPPSQLLPAQSEASPSNLPPASTAPPAGLPYPTEPPGGWQARPAP